jgi:spore germination cell wall hydrolase CwlJ-like protein
LWTSRDRSEGSLSESAVTNTALTHRKVDLNQNPITPILSALPVPAKAKPSIFSSILQDEKNRKNTEVIEVAGEDSELS